MSLSFMDVRRRLDEFVEKKAFIFLPSPILENEEESLFKPIVEVVYLRNDEVYEQQKKFRIHYNGLLRLAAAASFEWSAIDTCRTDNMSDRDYCSFRAVGGVMHTDGRIHTHKAEKDIDLAVLEMEFEDKYAEKWRGGNHGKWPFKDFVDGDDYIKAMVRRDMIQKRKNKLTLTESGAKARVIRFVLGLQSQYSRREDVLGRPHVMVSYIPNINRTDVKDAMAQSLIASRSMVYGGAAALPLASPGRASSARTVPGDDHTIQMDDAETPGQYEADSSIVDFENSPVEDQVDMLKKLCQNVGDSFARFEEHIGGEFNDANQATRTSAFEFFIKKKKGKLS